MKKKIIMMLVGKPFSFILLFTLVCYSGVLFGQTKSVTGVVVEQGSDSPVSHATIRVKGSQAITTANAIGQFQIIASNGAVLEISSVNYSPLEVPANFNDTMRIELALVATQLTDVIVVGYGTQRKSDVSGAVTSVKAEDLQGIPSRSVAEMLRGKAAGVAVTTSSARPGGTSDIVIRGQRSLTGGNGPLYVVDNVPVDATTANDINASDIASVEILKDASSQAIYGARAANGVILITTKRGLAKRVSVSYQGYGGVQQLKKNFSLYNATEWAQLRREAYRTDNNGMYLPDEDVFDPTMLEMLNKGEEINWQKFMIRDAFLHKHDVSVRGGTDKTKVAFSLGYFNQQGMVENSGFERGTMRLNVDQEISKAIKIGANINYARNFQTQEDGNLSEYIIVTPLAKPFDDNGDLQLWVDNISTPNPKFLNEQTTDERRGQRLLLSFFGNVDLYKGLTYRLNTSLTSSTNENGTYRTSKYQKGSNIGSRATLSNGNSTNYLIENVLTYNKDINDNNRFDVTAMQSYYNDVDKSTSIEGMQLPNDILGYNGIYAAQILTPPSRNISERTLISYMGRVRYTLMNRYLFMVTTRVDGSSVFGPKNKFGVFPSASFAWRMEQEEFIKNVNWISQLKLRANYGQVGNQAISPYTTLGEASSYPMLFGDGSYQIGYLPNNTLPNPYLKWETTTALNLGVDYSLFKNRLSGAIEYYKSNTTDLLVRKSIPESLGYTGMLTNIGEVENRGVELTLNAVPIRKKDFNWSIDVTFARNRNKLISLDGSLDENGKPVNDINNNWFIGEEIEPYYNYIFDGIWQVGDDIANSAQPQAQPGDIRVKDLNGDGKIDATNDRAIIKNDPKWIGSIGTRLNYKGFDFLVDFYTVRGAIKSNSYLYVFNDGGSLTGKTNGVKVNYWTPENPSNEFPRPRQNSSILYFSSLGYQDASYLRLRTITLGYTLPKNITTKAKLQSVRIYASGNNVWTKTKYLSYNPESNPGSYPEPRMFLFGLNVSL